MKKIIILSMVILVALFLLGCTSEDASANDSNNVISDSNKPNSFDINAQSASSGDIDLYKLARGTKNSSLCDQISDKDISSKCYFDFAKDTNDFSFCEKISSFPLKSNCFQKIALDTNK